MLDPQKILKTVRRATEMMRSTPGRDGSVVSLDDVEDVLIVGDIHGHLHVLTQVLKIAALDKHPRRHLVLQEPTHDTRVNPDDGDVDRSHRLIDLICALKCQTPERVHLILGNHELSEFTGRSISKNGFALNGLFRQGVQESYGDHADAIVAAYHDLFRALPLAVRTPNRVLLVHTIPDALALDTLDLDVLRSAEWPPEAIARGGTVYALTWGRDTSPETVDRFAAMVDADFFLTGHQPCEKGFKKANHRTIILDGTDPYPTYCLFKANEPASLDALAKGIRLVPMPRD